MIDWNFEYISKKLFCLRIQVSKTDICFQLIAWLSDALRKVLNCEIKKKID